MNQEDSQNSKPNLRWDSVVTKAFASISAALLFLTINPINEFNFYKVIGIIFLLLSVALLISALGAYVKCLGKYLTKMNEFSVNSWLMFIVINMAAIISKWVNSRSSIPEDSWLFNTFYWSVPFFLVLFTLVLFVLLFFLMKEKTQPKSGLLAKIDYLSIPISFILIFTALNYISNGLDTKLTIAFLSVASILLFFKVVYSSKHTEISVEPRSQSSAPPKSMSPKAFSTTPENIESKTDQMPRESTGLTMEQTALELKEKDSVVGDKMIDNIK